MERDNVRRIRRIALATIVGTVALGGAIKASEAQASAPIKTISCTNTDRWYGATEGFVQGDRLSIKASAVVIPADVSVDGVQQYDNNADTATLVGLKSRNNTDVTWQVNLDYPASVLVLPCKAGSNLFYTAVGREASRLDTRLGANDAEVSVGYNYIKK
jgi:hypothetical protein